MNARTKDLKRYWRKYKKLMKLKRQLRRLESKLR